MVRAALLVAILVTGMMGHSRVEQTLASSASLSLIFPPASAFLLSAAVAGGKTALTEQSDPQQGFVRSYAYNIAGGADAFGDSYTVNVSTSHADALVASHKDRSQDQPGIANYRVEGSVPI